MPPHETSPLLGSESASSGDRIRFVHSTRYLLLGSWINLLLIAVPLSLWSEHAEWPASYRFITSFLAIIPLAKVRHPTIAIIICGFAGVRHARTFTDDPVIASR